MIIRLDSKYRYVRLELHEYEYDEKNRNRQPEHLSILNNPSFRMKNRTKESRMVDDPEEI